MSATSGASIPLGGAVAGQFPALATLTQALQSKGLRYVGIRGRTESSLAYVGEAAGADEDACGLPFMGASGRENDRMLVESGFSYPQNEMYFTNVYKTRPPDNKIDRLSELGIPNDLFERQFFEELNFYRPTIILAAGKTATNLLCPFTVPKEKRNGQKKEDGFGKWRGSLLSSPLLPWPHYVIPVYHPAFVLRSWSERQISVLIYSRAKEELQFYAQNSILKDLPSRTLRYDPSYDEVSWYLRECLAQPEPVSLDIEMLYAQKKKLNLNIRYVNILGIARSAYDGLAFSPFEFSGSQRIALLRLYNRVLVTKAQIGQNFTIFDCHWLRSLGFRPNLGLVSDTLVRHHTLWPELEHSLAFMCMQYTREPFYKDQGKIWPFGANVKQIRKYCCRDVCVTYEVHNEQDREFDSHV